MYVPSAVVPKKKVSKEYLTRLDNLDTLHRAMEPSTRETEFLVRSVRTRRRALETNSGMRG